VLKSAELVAFVATTDFKRARDFYEGVLGLRFVRDDSFALVFDCAGTTLRIAKVRDVDPQEYTALGWHVDDIRATAAALKSRGVEFIIIPGFRQDDLGVWTSPNATKVAWFKDPDGNTLSLSQGPGPRD
jgi:catechol 2,3-dioxygenase-like lactoylglutathione lyase family enzyme